MSTHYLAAGFIIIGVGVVFNYLAKERAQESGKNYEYRYPKSIIYMLMGCFILPVLLLLAPDGIVREARSQFVITALVIGFALAAATIYCSMFFIRLTDNSIEYGALVKSQIRYCDIVAITYWSVGNGQYIKLKCSNGRAKTFERGVQDLDGLAKSLYRRLQGKEINFEERGCAKFTI